MTPNFIPSLSLARLPPGGVPGCVGGACVRCHTLFPVRRRRPMKSRAFRHPVSWLRVSLEKAGAGR